MKKELKQHLHDLGYHDLDFKNFRFDGEMMYSGLTEVCYFSQEGGEANILTLDESLEMLIPFSDLYDLFPQLPALFVCDWCDGHGQYITEVDHSPNSDTHLVNCDCEGVVFSY